MSEFRKFENSKSWRDNLKRFILQERHPQLLAAPQINTNRFSLDLAEDLETLVEDKMMQLREKNSQDKSNDIKESEKDKMQTNTVKWNKVFIRNADETVIEQTLQRPDISDDSFEAMEQMCNKTGSDPNSTLFKYLHSDDKENILASVKQRVSDETRLKAENAADIDPEDYALQRMLNELCVEKVQKPKKSTTPLGFTDETQLEDIEAPSKLWENTILSETTLQTSPVKMVGLLRPSTILEECTEDRSFSDASSQISYKKETSNESSTSYYETAPDTTASSASNTLINHKLASESAEDPQDLMSFDKTLPITDGMDADSEKSSLAKTTHFHCANTSINLIDWSTPVKTKLSYPFNTKIGEQNGKLKSRYSMPIAENVHESSEDSVIEVDSEDDDNANVELTSIIDNNLKHNSIGEDSINNSSNLETSGEKSLVFNDTLEEVEYMMKKGMEYMAAAAAREQSESVKKPLAPDSIPPTNETFTFSEKEQNTSRFKETSCSSNKNAQRFQLDWKRQPRSEFFKKPATTTVLRNKDSAKKQYAHIVSPIGAYIKKTIESPLIASQNLYGSSVNGTVARELHFSHNHQNIQVPLQDGKNSSPLPVAPRRIPKKAYISSQFKQVVDARAPVKIPGGDKMQKMLEPAMAPTVFRHDGKLKLASVVNPNTGAISKVPVKAHTNTPSKVKKIDEPTSDATLSDLSVMSGEISLYTIKDAQQF